MERASDRALDGWPTWKRRARRSHGLFTSKCYTWSIRTAYMRESVWKEEEEESVNKWREFKKKLFNYRYLISEKFKLMERVWNVIWLFFQFTPQSFRRQTRKKFQTPSAKKNERSQTELLCTLCSLPSLGWSPNREKNISRQYLERLIKSI